MASSPFQIPLLFLLLSIFYACNPTQATVPVANRFTFTNQGEFGPYITEYDAAYRSLPLSTFPFQLFFYNTTPNAFVLALRMGNHRRESSLFWVWEANSADPVRENATLTFGADGNLVLADADGRVAWSTGTANNGVIGLRLLPNGNIVLYDKKGKFIWQSFDYPTDTLLVGQSLRLNGINKLVSRESAANGSRGAYSLVLEPHGVSMYYHHSGRLLPYMKSTTDSSNQAVSLTFSSDTDPREAYELNLMLRDTTGSENFFFHYTRPKYNSTLSFLRLGIDGNLRTFTFDRNVFWGSWDQTSAVFSREMRFISVSECLLPSKCGKFGLCENSQCVACPTQKGLMGWSESCAPPKVRSCESAPPSVDYYRIDGVEHFLSRFEEGEGPVSLGECKKRCTKDCDCVGFFYRKESSKCLLAPVLGTLVKGSNSSHSAFIQFGR